MKLPCEYGSRDFAEFRVSEMGKLVVELTDCGTQAKVVLSPLGARKLRKFLKKHFPKPTAGAADEHPNS